MDELGIQLMGQVNERPLERPIERAAQLSSNLFAPSSSY